MIIADYNYQYSTNLVPPSKACLGFTSPVLFCLSPPINKVGQAPFSLFGYPLDCNNQNSKNRWSISLKATHHLRLRAEKQWVSGPGLDIFQTESWFVRRDQPPGVKFLSSLQAGVWRPISLTVTSFEPTQAQEFNPRI